MNKERERIESRSLVMVKYLLRKVKLTSMILIFDTAILVPTGECSYVIKTLREGIY